MLSLHLRDDVLELVPTALGNRAKEILSGKKLSSVELQGSDLDTGTALCAGERCAVGE